MHIWLILYRDPDPAAGGGGGGTPPASAGGTVPLPPAGTGAATPPAFALPDAFKDKPYLKGVDSIDKVYTMLDGAQELIGKRPAGIPAVDATPEEKAKFYDAAGRPKTAAEYVFDYGKDAQGNPIASKDPVGEGKIKEVMYKNGISADQAKGLQKDVMDLVAATVKEKGIVDAQSNTDFDKLGAEIYGAERDKVVEKVGALIKEFAHPKLAAGISKLTPEALMIMSSVLKGVSDKYIKADGAPGGQGGAGGQGGQTPDAMRAEAQRLMATPEYTNSMHPQHTAVRKQIDDLYIRATATK